MDYSMKNDNSSENKELSKKNFTDIATYVSKMSILGNVLLSIVKFLAGVFAHSGAMISDAIHSLSDVLSSVIVIVGIRIASKDSDENHPYGHERLECIAAIVLSFILLATGYEIGKSALEHMVGGSYKILHAPGLMALLAAIISIGVKEGMFWYTRYYAKAIDSSALMADAWHHRSDALSSIGALIGIAGARMGYPIMDPLASLLICGFIAKAAYEIFMDAVSKLIDTSLDYKTEIQMKQTVAFREGVYSIDMFQTRMFGSKVYVDVEIGVDGSMSLVEAHKIAEDVHKTLEHEFPKVKHVMVHVNPIKIDEDTCTPNLSGLM